MALLVGGIVGCRQQPTTPRPAAMPYTPPGSAPTVTGDEQLKQAKVNESGEVPILEYHDVVARENPKQFARSQANFRRDLERLYAEGYRPVLLHDYLDNRIAIPLGTSPVVFTFDDSRASQFRYLPDGTVDPDCALGIFQAFAARHPDFPVKATFYVLPDTMFGQPKLATKKLQTLLALGCEIGNHTVKHLKLASLSDQEVQQELAGCVSKTQHMLAQVQMDTVALPYGSFPHNRALLASGSSEGQTYANRAALKVGAEPAPSPASTKFKPMALPRIQAYDGESGSTFWLNQLKKHPKRRYVSDGDPHTITVPKAEVDKVDTKRLQGATLRTY